MLGWLLFNKCINELERKLGSEMATSANDTALLLKSKTHYVGNFKREPSELQQ